MTNIIHDLIVKAEQPVMVPQGWPTFDEDLKAFLQYLRIPLPSTGALQDFQFVMDIPTYLGVEIEVENIHQSIALPAFWQQKEDGSLRNGGAEFFFTAALLPKQSMLATVILWALLDKLSKKSPDFSWRTSIHVHLNVQDLTEDELKNLILLAVVFEPLLFRFAGEDRTDSIFCVPITESTSLYALNNYFHKKCSLRQLCENWHKYSAVNFSRLFAGPGPELPALGTVEFRHLPGTNDLKKVLVWQMIVLQLFKAAVHFKSADLRDYIKSLNYSSEYMHFAQQVFTANVLNPLKITDPAALFSVSISRAKELLIPPPKLMGLSSKSSLVKVAQKMQERRNALKKIKAPRIKSTPF